MMMENNEQNGKQEYQGEWGVLELMGKVRLGGFISEQKRYGVDLIRIDIPGKSGAFEMTRFYHPNALYCMTPTGETEARAVAARTFNPPVSVWEMPRPQLTEGTSDAIDAGDDDGPDDDSEPL